MKATPSFGGRLVALALLSMAAHGCNGGDKLPREPVSGKVVFNGQPLKSGLIQFQPSTAQEGIAAGGMIVDGQYKVEREGGPVPGKYAVMIFAKGENPQEPPPAENEMPGDRPPAKRSTGTGLIPLRYNMETKLSAVVKAGEPNIFDFTLEK